MLKGKKSCWIDWNQKVGYTSELAWIWTSSGTGLTLGLKLNSPTSSTPNQSARSLKRKDER